MLSCCCAREPEGRHDVLAGMISAAGMDVGGAGVGHDPSADSGAAHLAVSRLTIGTWNLVSKHDEHILLSFYWAERKLVWEVLHAGVVRKMEVGFEDVVEAALSSSGPEDPERLVLELARPPRFFKEQMTVAGGAKQANYVYTTDFTSGQASQVSRHILYFAAGMASGQADAMKAHGLPIRSEGASRGGDLMGSSALLGGSGGGVKATGHASSAALRQPPTSSPRLDAIILQEQLDREMRERQARYSGICSVRQSIFGTAFNELHGAVARNESKRGKTCAAPPAPHCPSTPLPPHWPAALPSRAPPHTLGRLKFVRDEASMSIDAYKAVFESSITFGVRKLNQVGHSKLGAMVSRPWWYIWPSSTRWPHHTRAAP